MCLKLPYAAFPIHMGAKICLLQRAPVYVGLLHIGGQIRSLYPLRLPFACYMTHIYEISFIQPSICILAFHSLHIEAEITLLHSVLLPFACYVAHFSNSLITGCPIHIDFLYIFITYAKIHVLQLSLFHVPFVIPYLRNSPIQLAIFILTCYVLHG
jgi:hypothetical protein